MQLYIGNKNYSSWSMRPWVLMREKGIDFEEVRVRFDAFTPDSAFKRTLATLTPTGCVPVLVIDGLAVWDTLAIVETLAERHPDRGIWPESAAARARARSVCAEMHAGFGALRSAMPMNIEALLPEVGARLLSERADVRADVARVLQLWDALLQRSGGPLLCGPYSAVDAYYAPVAMRLRSYGVPVPPAIDTYLERLSATEGVAAWVTDALREADFRPFEEPYRSAR